MNINQYDALFGQYFTPTFSEIFPSFETFLAEWNDYPFSQQDINQMSEKYLSLGYYLLLGRYGNSSIASADPIQFKLQLFTIFFTHGPAWVKRLEIQDKIRNLQEDDIVQGGKVINNQALNPGTEPTTEELSAINAQNTSNRKKSRLEAYSSLLGLIKTDVSMDFINEFKRLFITVVQPNSPLWFITEGDN